MTKAPILFFIGLAMMSFPAVAATVYIQSDGQQMVSPSDPMNTRHSIPYRAAVTVDGGRRIYTDASIETGHSVSLSKNFDGKSFNLEAYYSILTRMDMFESQGDKIELPHVEAGHIIVGGIVADGRDNVIEKDGHRIVVRVTNVE